MNNKEYNENTVDLPAENYEERINHSPLLQMDPDADPSAYEREKNRFVTLVYQYKIAISKSYLDCGAEIVDACYACLKSYTPEKGLFSHYFDVALSNRVKISKAKEKVDTISGGQGFSKAERKILTEVHRFMEKHPHRSKEQMIQLIQMSADKAGVSPEVFSQWINTYKTMHVDYMDAPVDKDEETTSVLEMIAGKDDQEKEYIDRETAIDWIRHLEQVYLQTSTRSRDVLKMKLTGILTECFFREEYEDMIRGAAFFDERVYLYVQQSGKAMKNREISMIIGKSEQNISQIWKRFIEKLKEE